MLKWFLRITYIMILSIATMYVFGSSNYSRLTDYYEKYMMDYINDTEVYLEGINTVMNLDYHKEIITAKTYTSQDEKMTLTLNFYAIGATVDKKLYDGLMIFVNNVRIENEDGVLINPILKIEVLLSDETYKSETGKSNIAVVEYNPTQKFPFSYVPIIFLLNAENYLLIDDDSDIDAYATIESISISYGVMDADGIVNYDPTLLFIGSDTILEDPAYIKANDFQIDESLFDLKSLFAGDRPTDQEIESLGLITTRGSLTEFNYIIWKNMAIFGVVVIALTYVLFFHKIVWQKIQERKQVDKPVVIKQKPDQIFNDVDDKQKDGK